MYTKIKSFGFYGLDSFCVDVEVDISRGLPSFDIVGLPDATVKESKDRVRASIKNCGFEFPISKVTVNLAPADIKKYGPIYDLPIFIAILKASSQLDFCFDEFSFFGELSLNGDVRGIDGALIMMISAYKNGVKNIFLPKGNLDESKIINGVNIYPVENVKQISDHFKNIKTIKPIFVDNNSDFIEYDENYQFDFKDVKGQSDAKYALEIAAAGGHNVLMIGPPGSGKSMLSKRIPSIMPTMTFEEVIESTMIHSISGNLRSSKGLINQRPFRSPHHTVSYIGLAGGGVNIKPGEVSLAHNGVLFLDEFPEFSRKSLEILRQPIEDNEISISRAKSQVTYPSNIMLVAAMNPCPCGNYGNQLKNCICTPYAIKRYLSKISGPLLDRFDLQIEVPCISYDEITSEGYSEPSKDIRQRVQVARDKQKIRYKNFRIKNNAKITSDMVKDFCNISNDVKDLLKMSFEKLGFSARAYDKILKVALTIADLDDKNVIDTSHISRAISYRSLDKKYWNSF